MLNQNVLGADGEVVVVAVGGDGGAHEAVA